MHHHLFDHIDIDPKNIHIPDGTLEGDEIDKFCRDYEKAIDAAGGIDLQILGIGRTGHIGFNEPGSFITSQTRKVFLNDLTIKDAIKDFGSRNLVPTKAITMGVGTIMQARRVILMAWGEKRLRLSRLPWKDGCQIRFRQLSCRCILTCNLLLMRVRLAN